MSAESTAAVEVVRSVSVPLSQARTFELFTTRMTDFWPQGAFHRQLRNRPSGRRAAHRWAVVRTRAGRQRMPVGQSRGLAAAAKSGAALADRCQLAIRSRLRLTTTKFSRDRGRLPTAGRA